MTQLNCDILCLTETFSSSDFSENLLSMDGYSFFRRDRRCDHHSGGVLVYYCSSLSIKIRDAYQSVDTSVIETLVFSLTFLSTNPIIIIIVYRQPSAPAEDLEKFRLFMAQIADIEKEIVILGNLNIDALKHCDYRKLKFLADLSLHQLISEPTRIDSRSSTLIDHIYSNIIKLSNVL